MIPDQRRTAIELIALSKAYGSGAQSVTAVSETTLKIHENEFFTLLGPSGCGKTTLLRLIGGFESPSAGSILLDGKDIAEEPPYRRQLNTVFQNYALFPHMTVAQNIGFGLRMRKQSRKDIRDRVEEMLRLVRLEKFAERRVSQISGGQQQRIALARALAPRPKVLLLDESLSALDFKLRKEMQAELKEVQRTTGITFVFVTHDQEEALTMSDRIAVLNAGKIVQVGTPKEIYHKPANQFVAEFIGEANFLDGIVQASNTNSMLIRLDGLGELSCNPSGISVGAKIKVMIRPEHITISPTPMDFGHVGYGIVTDVIFRGVDTHYRIATPGTAEIVMRQANDPGRGAIFEVGDRAAIAFTPDAINVFPS